MPATIATNAAPRYNNPNMLTRRTFLASSAAVATKLFAAPQDSKVPSPDLEKMADAALREAKKNKATYCDIRIVRYRRQLLTMALSPQRGTGKTIEALNKGLSLPPGVDIKIRVLSGGAG